MTKIDQFRVALKDGGHRTNQFRVSIPFPSFAIQGESQSKLEFLCISASIPGRGIAETALKYRGVTVKLAGDREPAEDWTASVYNTKSFDIRATLDAWQSYYINNDAVTGSDLIPTVDATVEMLDKNDNVLRTYKMFNFWPKKIEGTELNVETENAISTFQTTFTYDYWDAV